MVNSLLIKVKHSMNALTMKKTFDCLKELGFQQINISCDKFNSGFSDTRKKQYNEYEIFNLDGTCILFDKIRIDDHSIRNNWKQFYRYLSNIYGDSSVVSNQGNVSDILFYIKTSEDVKCGIDLSMNNWGVINNNDNINIVNIIEDTLDLISNKHVDKNKTIFSQIKEVLLPIGNSTLLSNRFTILSKFLSSGKNTTSKGNGIYCMSNEKETDLTGSSLPQRMNLNVRIVPSESVSIVIRGNDLNKIDLNLSGWYKDKILITERLAAGTPNEQLFVCFHHIKGLSFRFSENDTISKFYCENSSSILEGTIASIQSKRVFGNEIKSNNLNFGTAGDCWSEFRTSQAQLILQKVNKFLKL
eukprot:gene12901-17285_t